jgi:hypothetical protein
MFVHDADSYTDMDQHIIPFFGLRSHGQVDVFYDAAEGNLCRSEQVISQTLIDAGNFTGNSKTHGLLVFDV